MRGRGSGAVRRNGDWNERFSGVTRWEAGDRVGGCHSSVVANGVLSLCQTEN